MGMLRTPRKLSSPRPVTVAVLPTDESEMLRTAPSSVVNVVVSRANPFGTKQSDATISVKSLFFIVYTFLFLHSLPFWLTDTQKAQLHSISPYRPCTASIHKWEVCAVGRILLVNRFALIISFRGASSTEKVEQSNIMSHAKHNAKVVNNLRITTALYKKVLNFM